MSKVPDSVKRIVEAAGAAILVSVAQVLIDEWRVSRQPKKEEPCECKDEQTVAASGESKEKEGDDEETKSQIGY